MQQSSSNSEEPGDPLIKLGKPFNSRTKKEYWRVTPAMANAMASIGPMPINCHETTPVGLAPSVNER
jgi:hypothetical protein